MPRMIFISLPVADLTKSRHFYETLGFTINETFSGDGSACVVVSDTIYVMLSTHDKYSQFSPLPIGDPRAISLNLFALSCDTKAEVDDMVNRAVAGGGADGHPPEDLGFMYSRAFTDPDGNGWGPFWMDPGAAADGPPEG